MKEHPDWSFGQITDSFEPTFEHCSNKEKSLFVAVWRIYWLLYPLGRLKDTKGMCYLWRRLIKSSKKCDQLTSDSE